MKRRVIIVDFNHMVYANANNDQRLSHIVDRETINATIKAIHKWSNGGCNPTAVCFDSPVPVRKSYFANASGIGSGTDAEYKFGRKSLTEAICQEMDVVKELLVESGISCFKKENYEASDLILACVDRAKEDYPDLPIDIISNDEDILPLVDEQVSVFLRSMETSWAESEDILKPNYVQVTPRNMEQVLSGMTVFKGFKIPYNAVLLFKLLRGDSDDNLCIDSVKEVRKLFPPDKFNALVKKMQKAGVFFDKLFRYGKAVEVVIKKGTGEVIAEHKLGRYTEDEIEWVLLDPNELGNLTSILSWHYDFGDQLSAEEVEELTIKVNRHIEIMYRGMNLNGYIKTGDVVRKPGKVESIDKFNEAIIDFTNIS